MVGGETLYNMAYDHQLWCHQNAIIITNIGIIITSPEHEQRYRHNGPVITNGTITVAELLTAIPCDHTITTIPEPMVP